MLVVASLCCGSMRRTGRWRCPATGLNFRAITSAIPDYQTEWWYYTGNLRAANGHRYGFELTFFRQAAHALAAGSASGRPHLAARPALPRTSCSERYRRPSFYHTERLNRAGPGPCRRFLGGRPLLERQLAGALDGTARRTSKTRGGMRSLHAASYASATKPPSFRGRTASARKARRRAQASHYISFTRIEPRAT